MSEPKDTHMLPTPEAMPAHTALHSDARTACGLSIVLAMQQQRTERMLEESERKNHVLQEQLRSQQASTEAWVMVDATQDHGQDCSPRCSYSHVEHLMRRRAEETREMEACLLSMQQQLGETQFQLDQTERELAAQRTGRAELDLVIEVCGEV
eukprot:TRINITY_DN3112_c0_g1_i9.p1 TRINITY_DN3112_c0_g1~~TRINITY_DN3112_c0_g1_i9.p1  ORF type:complete len:153 (-),score=36.51 TRINITY_DN3112_c0_g1_i9:828-1286(-)